MGSSGKPKKPGRSRVSVDTGPPDAADRFFSGAGVWKGRRLAVALSGGVDSVVLLHVLHARAPVYGYVLSAVHVHHGLSPNADAWARFVRRLCRAWAIPLSVRRVKVVRCGAGTEQAAREARYAQFAALEVDAVVLGHHLDDQAETVLLNLLRGTGLRGAAAMRAVSRLGGNDAGVQLLRPFLAVSRRSIAAYARRHRLDWVEDESNANVALRRNFLRQRIAPLLEQHYPRWREALARAAAHFAEAEDMLQQSVGAEGRLTVARLRRLGPVAAKLRLRSELMRQGLKPPTTRRLEEMLRQLLAASAYSRIGIAHDGRMLRVYRGEVLVTAAARAVNSSAEPAMRLIQWNGERRIALPALGGELRLARVRGGGIDPARIAGHAVTIGIRRGGERLQTDVRRPRRTLKNLYQESGIPSWDREHRPLIYCDGSLVWAPDLGVDVAYRASGADYGLLPQWRPRATAR